MDLDDIIIRCLTCGVKNRIPRGRFQAHPVCGRCHAPLDDMIIRCLACGKKNRVPEDRLRQKALCGKCGAPLVVAGDQGQVVKVDDGSFAREVLAGGPVLVDCWAPWCGPCQTIAPILEELASEYLGGVKITKLNVDENPLTAAQYKIQSIPTILIFKDGKLTGSLVGLRPKAEIERQILAIIKPN